MYRQPFSSQPQQRQMRKQICPQCRGQGKVMHNDVFNWGWKPCQACGGKGEIEIPIIGENRAKGRNSLGI